MTDAFLDDFPQEEEFNLPWFMEARDDDPASEFSRQTKFLAKLTKHAPSVGFFAVPNAGKRSDWERIQRWKEGARAGTLDLVIHWKPTRPDDRGIYFPEWKNGADMPSRAQRDRLNQLFRQGHGCGVYRRPETLLLHLWEAGAPFLSGGDYVHG